jgi:fructose-1,6-bisphosphatase/sedoheptulose 1,7-bisphosphatase-like protein
MKTKKKKKKTKMKTKKKKTKTKKKKEENNNNNKKKKKKKDGCYSPGIEKFHVTERREMLKFVCTLLAYTGVTSSNAVTQSRGAGSISCNERAAARYQPYPVKSAAHRK